MRAGIVAAVASSMRHLVELQNQTFCTASAPMGAAASADNAKVDDGVDFVSNNLVSTGSFFEYDFAATRTLTSFTIKDFRYYNGSYFTCTLRVSGYNGSWVAIGSDLSVATTTQDFGPVAINATYSKIRIEVVGFGTVGSQANLDQFKVEGYA